MKYDKIIIAGGTGYLGVLLSNYFLPVTRELVVLCRKIPSQKLPLTYVLWNGEDAGPWTEILENADLLINLCGRNVNCRYTAANKKQIIESRTRPTHALGEAVQQLVHPPKCWIHEHDLARIVDWLGAGNGTGIYNATAPGPVSNRDFMKTLRHTYGISVGLNAPQWLLEFGAAIIGTETELLLKSRWVLPERLQQQGFRFHYATAGDTIDDLLSLRC